MAIRQLETFYVNITLTNTEKLSLPLTTAFRSQIEFPASTQLNARPRFAGDD